MYKVFCGKVKDKLKTSTGAHELVNSAEDFPTDGDCQEIRCM